MISQRSLLLQSLVWLGTPVLLFIIFWWKWWISFPMLVLLVWSVIRIFSFRGDNDLRADGYCDVRMSRKAWGILAVVFSYVLICGIGGFVAQMPNDHAWRNAIFFDLARKPWPVVYGEGVDAPYLCYYFGFWLPAALVAKATGLIMAGDFAQVLWATWGIWIALCFIFSMTGGQARWSILLIFIFFNCWDALSSAFFSEEYYNIFEDPLAPQLMWLSTTSSRFGCSANGVFFNFIYNQAIPTWVMMCVILHERQKPQRLMFWFGMLVIFAPIPALALLPYIAFALMRKFRQIFTIPDLTGFLVAMLSSLFLLSNNSGGRLRVLDADGSSWTLLIMSVGYALLSYGVFIPLIWRFIRRCPLFWSLLVLAVVVPLFGIGTTPDLAWRISVPLVILLCIDICRLSSVITNSSAVRKGLFYAVIIVGSFSPCYLMIRTVVNEVEVARGQRESKLIIMMGHLDDPDFNVYYNNFICTPQKKNMWPKKCG